MMMMNRFVATRNGGRYRAFTLAELLVSIAVLALLLLLVSQLVNNAVTITRTGHKHFDADGQARAVFETMARDFGQMLIRPDIDYYFKGGSTKYPGHSGGHSKGGGQQGQTDLNDYICFFSQVPGYSTGSPSPLSLVGYRLNGLATSQSYNKLERLAKGLLWNGISNLNVNSPNTLSPIFFLPVRITDIKAWSTMGTNTADTQGDYETIGPQIFRFEYYYLLKSGDLTDSPWDADAGHTTINGLNDLEAIAVSIAVIDPASRSLLSDANLLDLQLYMEDFKTQKGNGPVKIGQVETQWNSVVTDPIGFPKTANMPRAALQGIRIYNRYFDLKTL
jgi:prepilin-type N-terminal cleavage/methylation domain-containing protein